MNQQNADYAVEVYLYGVVAADIDLPAELDGVQGQPVHLVEHEGIAVLASDVDPEQPLGTPEDLLAHTHTLDQVAASSAVLPLAFGTVVPDAEAVIEDVLRPSADTYAHALEHVAGNAQFTLTVTFDRETLLREIIEEVPEAAQLRQAIADTTEDQTRPQRIQLGELMVRELEKRQPAAAEPVRQRLQNVTADRAEHEQRQAEDVLELAVLVDRNRVEAFDSAVDDLARELHPRCRFRLVGPQAPYDFVPEV